MGNLGENTTGDFSLWSWELSSVYNLALQVNKLLYCRGESECCCALRKGVTETTKKGGGGEWKKTALFSRSCREESCSYKKGSIKTQFSL